MKIKITKTEFHKGGNGEGPPMERVHYLVTTKYFEKAKDVMWFLTGTSDKAKRVAIKKYNMWRCFLPRSRVLDLLFSWDKKFLKQSVPLSGR